MRRRCLRLAWGIGLALGPACALVGCDAVWGISDLMLDATSDGGASPTAADGSTTDAGAAKDASPRDGTVSDAPSGSTDGGMPDGDTGTVAEDASWCQVHAPSVLLCEDFDELSANALPPSGWMNPLVDGTDGSVGLASDIPGAPSPPNVLVTWTEPGDGTRGGQASMEYDVDAALLPTSVTLSFSAFLAQALPPGPDLYISIATLNFVGSGLQNPYNLEICVSSTGILLRTIPANDSSAPVAQVATTAAIAQGTWSAVQLTLQLNQSSSAPSIKATLAVDGDAGLTATEIGQEGAYGPVDLIIGNTFVFPGTPPQTLYIDDVVLDPR